MMGTVVDGVQWRRAGGAQHAGHGVVDLLQLFFANEPSRNHRLIADDNQAKAGRFEKLQGFGNTGHEVQFLGVRHQTAIFDKHPVAVKKNGRACGLRAPIQIHTRMTHLLPPDALLII
jgi:hypothetical protein